MLVLGHALKFGHVSIPPPNRRALAPFLILYFCVIIYLGRAFPVILCFHVILYQLFLSLRYWIFLLYYKWCKVNFCKCIGVIGNFSPCYKSPRREILPRQKFLQEEDLPRYIFPPLGKSFLHRNDYQGTPKELAPG